MAKKKKKRKLKKTRSLVILGMILTRKMGGRMKQKSEHAKLTDEEIIDESKNSQ